MRLAFAGTPKFAEQALVALLEAGHDVALVLTQPDRPAGRGMQLMPSPVKQLAIARGIEVAQPRSLAAEDALAPLRSARADIMVVVAYGLLLPSAALHATARGALNIHASLLPRWRGAAPIQRAILAGDRQTGISIMQMDAGLDTGPVVATKPIPIEQSDDAGSLHDKLAAAGAQLIVDVLARLDSLTPAAQPSEGATYARKIEKRDTLLDWSRGAAELERAVRAFRPAPGASTVLEQAPLKIWRARVVDGKAVPGTVLQAADELVVACGEQALAVSELQRGGGKRLPAAEFLRGTPVAPGILLGTAGP